MNQEKSCGAIVYLIHNDEILYLILKHKAGHWAFPKGHVENSETEIETALREINEETGLQVAIDSAFQVSNVYRPKPDTIKEVVYFLAKANTKKVSIQQAEITSFRWCSISEAKALLTYDSDRSILIKTDEHLRLKNKYSS